MFSLLFYLALFILAPVISSSSYFSSYGVSFFGTSSFGMEGFLHAGECMDIGLSCSCSTQRYDFKEFDELDCELHLNLFRKCIFMISMGV